MSFPRYLRSSAKDVNALLREVLPDRVYSEHYEADRVFAATRSEWNRLGGLGWNALQGVVVKPYPPHFISPWEDARRIQASRPPAVPPDDPRVLRLPQGRVAFKTEDASVPVLLEIQVHDEPDDGAIEVDAGQHTTIPRARFTLS